MRHVSASLWLLAVALLATGCGQLDASNDAGTAAATKVKLPAYSVSSTVAGTAATTLATAPDGVPTILNPYEEMKEFDPSGVLRWSEVAGADAYEVWVYSFSPGADLTLAENSGTLGSRNYRFTKLVGGQTYYARMYSRVSGTWVESPMFPIATTARVLKPRLSNPQDEIETFAAEGILRWDVVPGATSYEAWIYGDSGLGTVIEASGPLGVTQYQPRNLPNDRTYYVQLYSLVDGVFHAGAALPVHRTIKFPTEARLLNPQDEIASFGPNGVLRWSGVAFATAYEAWIFTNPSASEIYEASGPLGTARSYTTRTLQPDTTYYVRIYAFVVNRWVAGAPQRIRTASTVSVARLANAQTELTEFDPRGTLTWNAVPGADRYEVWIFGNAGLGIVSEAGVGSGTSYAVRRLCAPATYYVQVYARVGGQWTVGGATPVRTKRTVTTDCVAPVPLVHLDASPAEVAHGGDVTLRWSSDSATTCAASGAWTGAKSTQGEEVVSPVTTRSEFTLDCTGPAGATRARAMVRIAIPDYEVTRIGYGRWGVALNDGGEVVGSVSSIMPLMGTLMTRVYTRPFIYSGGQTSGMLPEGTSGAAYGINASAQAVGQSGTAFLWTSTSLVNLGTLGGIGGIASAAQGINASGQVVGWSATAESGTMRAFSYANGNMTDLGTLGGRSSWAYGVDDAGRVVGAAETAAGQRHAFLLSGGTMTDLGTLKGGTSTAYAIGASGTVVGMSDDHAFRFANGTMEDLGALGGNWSASYGVNGSGDVVGAAESSAWSWSAARDVIYLQEPDQRAFVFQFGAMYDLNEHLAQPIDGLINEARAINASGQIVANQCATWFLPGGVPFRDCAALLLTPLREVVPRQ